MMRYLVCYILMTVWMWHNLKKVFQLGSSEHYQPKEKMESDLTPFLWELSQSETLSEIKPLLAKMRIFWSIIRKTWRSPFYSVFTVNHEKKIKQITHLEPTRPVHRHFVVVILTIWETKGQRQPLQQPGFVARYQKQYLSAPKQPQIAARGCQYPRDTWPGKSSYNKIK